MQRERIAEFYRLFNARDIEAVIARLHPDVRWPNGWEGGTLLGTDTVRDYWQRQWATIDPSVEPLDIAEDEAGRTVVRVHQVVRDLEGNVRSDGLVEHVYTFEGDLVTSMELGPIEG